MGLAHDGAGARRQPPPMLKALPEPLPLTGWVARMESQRRSDRTKAGLARVKANGQRLGRPVGAKETKQRKRRRLAV